MFLPDSHLLFSLDTITSNGALPPHTDTDMNIIYSAEDCNINLGGAALINYRSLHYTYDDRVKYQQRSFIVQEVN